MDLNSCFQTRIILPILNVVELPGALKANQWRLCWLLDSFFFYKPIINQQLVIRIRSEVGCWRTYCDNGAKVCVSAELSIKISIMNSFVTSWNILYDADVLIRCDMPWQYFDPPLRLFPFVSWCQKSCFLIFWDFGLVKWLQGCHGAFHLSSLKIKLRLKRGLHDYHKCLILAFKTNYSHVKDALKGSRPVKVTPNCFWMVRPTSIILWIWSTASCHFSINHYFAKGLTSTFDTVRVLWCSCGHRELMNTPPFRRVT